MNSKTNKKSFSDSLRIIPLGGQEEVGRNMTIFEYKDDIVILDMGMQFPEEDTPGIDYIIPNVDYLEDKKDRIRAVIFSHGHLDHIGAAPLLLKRLGNPLIIGRDFTLELIKHRQNDLDKGSAKNLKTMLVQDINQVVKLGAFTLKFFAVEHSIMDCVGVILETDEGTVIHPGDWTIDRSKKNVVSYEHLANIKKPSILMLESLGVSYTEERVPEAAMYKNLESLISGAPGRTIIATFASQVERISHLIEYAGKIGKKVALDGYSMKVNMSVAQKLGYVKKANQTIIDIKSISKYKDKEIVILCTGAQGEDRAVLNRIVQGSHRHIKAKKSDTIVFSSSVIPGNERSIQRLKDHLYRLSDNVIHSDIMDVHSGGHSNQKDMVEMIKQIKPTYFLPVYANHYMLKETEKLAIRNGFPKNNISILDNGSIFELKDNKTKITHGTINASYVFVDGSRVGDIGKIVIKDREKLSDDGIFVVIVVLDKRTKRLQNSPDIISRGFIYLKESREMLAETRKRVVQTTERIVAKKKFDEDQLKKEIRNVVTSYLFEQTERKPMVLPVVIKV